MWHWLLTSTTYGTWLPGDARGSVTSVRDYRSTDTNTRIRVEHDQLGEAWEAPVPGLQRSAIAQMKGEAVWLTVEQADILLEQFKASAAFRDWRLLAVAIMPNHFHLVVAIAIDFDPAKMLQEFKGNGSRALNHKFPKPASGTWWTKSGSKRKLKDEAAVTAAVNYVLHKQPNPLFTWSDSHHHG
ncbi:Transposase IS200 like protein [Botrimarina colliarenosi]|uniref:Transposase IS200 like protein n=1 Tax=Botrimarina colliarenosi TaxID=2528001 RepID=A0A5C6AKA5_9BACT|nr:transposase [Botrimarina colliarenosi]TWT99595.1 Transposase IS200 like protein [Botrimarina colliarenosi]